MSVTERALGSGRGRGGIVARLAGTVAAGAAAVLVGGLLAPAPATAETAGLPYGSRLTLQYQADVGSECRFSPDTTVRTADPLASGGNAALTNNAPVDWSVTGPQGSGQGPAVQPTQSTAATVLTSGGELSAFSVAAQMRASFGKAGELVCGSNGWMASLTPHQSFTVLLPIVHAGWLDLSGSASGRGKALYQVALLPAGSTSATAAAAGDLFSGLRRRVYLPAGWSVSVSILDASFSAESRFPDNGLSSGSLSLSFSGRVTLAGAAVNAAHGKRFARRSVALPAAVSCSGSAAVRLTRYARKKAKSVTFLVNGHRVRTVKRIKRARTLGIRVPTSGPITISAKVTPKHGKKARVTRSYAACR